MIAFVITFHITCLPISSFPASFSAHLYISISHLNPKYPPPLLVVPQTFAQNNSSPNSPMQYPVSIEKRLSI